MCPEVGDPVSGGDAAEGKDVRGAWNTPELAGRFVARAADRLAAGLNHAGPDEEALLAEGGVLRACDITWEVPPGKILQQGLKRASARESLSESCHMFN